MAVNWKAIRESQASITAADACVADLLEVVVLLNCAVAVLKRAGMRGYGDGHNCVLDAFALEDRRDEIEKRADDYIRRSRCERRLAETPTERSCTASA